MDHQLDTNDRLKIKEYFDKTIDQLTYEEFEEKLKALRARYHPDKFERYDDEIIRELSLSRFKEIESLADKIKKYFKVPHAVKDNVPVKDEIRKYAGKDFYIEILTTDKDLKYHLFGTRYRFLEYGDKYTIPGTKASITIDANYRGRGIGFNESIKMYLTFGEQDSLSDIVHWMYLKMVDRANSIIIGDTLCKIDEGEILMAIQNKTILRIGHAA